MALKHKINERGLGSRKALDDISNSTKSSAFQVSKKRSSNNVIAIDRDVIATRKTPYAVGGKENAYKRPQKRQSGGRKALGDLTNSEKPSLQKVTQKSQDKKLSVISEEFDIEDEGFLHNQQECIKAQRIVMEKKCFLELDDDISSLRHPFLPLALESRSPSPEPLEIMPVMMFDEYDDLIKSPKHPKYINSLASLSPISPRLSSFWSSLREYHYPDFRLIESPRQSNV